MNELKERLFKVTDYNAKMLQQLLSIKPDWDTAVVVARVRFSVLYDLIEDCNLEEEYYAWKESVNNGKDN